MKHSLFVLCVLASLRPEPALAQFDTATIVGTIRDDSGAVIRGATVTLTNRETDIATATRSDEDGNYEFVTIRIGSYRITAELAGFSVAVADDVQATIGARQRVDLRLAAGTISETVQVVGAASRLETDSSQRGHVVSSAQIVQLPLNGREYSSFVALSPGVRLTPLSNAPGSTIREGSFNVNGLRSTFNNFLLDGLDNNAYGTSNQGFSNQVMQPSPDAVAEIRIVTNNLSAEYGRSAGATINVATRAGTNRLHGSGWEFYRDTRLNATGFFKPPTGEKPPLSRDQFGLVTGGPLIPNRAFFFTEYEGFRQTRKSVAFQTIPNRSQRQGILAVDVRNPLTGQLYPAGTPIPMTAFARKVFSELPDPTSAGASNNFAALQEFTNVTDKWSVRVDAQVSPAFNVFGRYGYRDVDAFDQPPLPLPAGGGGNGVSYVTNKQLTSGFTWARSTSSLFEARFGWGRTIAGKNPVAIGTRSALDEFGLPGLPSDPRVAGGLPTQLITGYSDLGRQTTNPQWQYPELFNPKVNYTRIAGFHSLKAGYEFQHIGTEIQDVNPLYGRDSYSGQFTRPSDAPASNLYNLADFMLGLRSQYALSNILIVNLRQQMHFTYLQDDYRVNDNLTLNLGLRYEYATPHWERDDILSNYDPALNRMVAATDGPLQDRALVMPDRNNFGPRLGFAYTLGPAAVVRGGYGVSYVHFHRAGAANLLPINAPQVINAVEVQTDARSTSFRPTEQGYPDGFTDASRFDPLRSNVTYMPRDYQSSRVQSYFVSMQREVGGNMLVDVAYVGNRASGLLLFANLNQARPNNPEATIPLASRRPISGFGDITYAFNGGISRYNSLQVKFEYRLRHGVMVQNAFTWSKAKDNSGGALESGGSGNFPGPQDLLDLAADYGTSGYDQPYNNTTSFAWEVPIGRGRRWLSEASPLVDGVFGGWRIAGVGFLTSGEAVTLTYTPAASFLVSGIQQDFRGANNFRPNVTGDPYADRDSTTNYLNRETVVIPTNPSQPFGNAARNSVRGPSFGTVDLIASKEFPVPLGTSTRLELRFEAFNLLNRTNFRGPQGSRSAGNFGTIISTFDARQIQLGIKLTF